MRFTALAVTLSVALLAPIVAVQDPDVRLQQAIQQEVASGDLKAAIAEYRRIAEDTRAARSVRARAMLRMADAHRRLGDAEAQKIYRQILSDFADQGAAVAEARSRLSTSPEPGAPSQVRATRQIWVGADTMGTVSPDGRYLSFTDWETGDLAVRDLLKQTNRRLTATGGWEKSGDYAEFSAISDDGRLVAYAWYTEGSSRKTAYSLRLVSTEASGAPPRVLHHDQGTAWVQPFAFTKDGRTVIFLRQLPDRTHEIATIGVDGLALRVIKQLGPVFPTKVSISPDGRHIAYDSSSVTIAGARDVHVVRLDGTGDTAVVRHHANDYGPLWSPDGTSILFISDRTGSGALWRQPMKNGLAVGPPQFVTAEVQDLPVGITRSGALLYGKGGNFRNIYSASLDGNAKATGDALLVTERFLNSNRAATWSPDGRRLAYYTAQGRSPQGPGSTSVAVLDVESNDLRVVPLPILAGGGPSGVSWFPDGRALLVVGRNIEQPNVTFNRLDLTTGDLRLLHRTKIAGTVATRPALSRDGTTLFYIDGLKGDRSRSLMRLELGTGRVTEIKTSRWIGSVAVSFDGDRLAYIEQPDGDGPPRARLVVAPAGGGDERILFEAPWADGSRIGTITWSPDGKFVFFVRPDARTRRQLLWRVPSSGGEPEPTGISTAGVIKNPDVHPDGRRIVFTGLENVPLELWLLENFLQPPPATK